MNRRSVSKNRFGTGRAVAVGAALVACCGPLPAAPATTSTASVNGSGPLAAKVASAINLVAKDKAGAVVRVRSRDKRGEINGTGFYIDPTGTVCTLAELVQGSGEIVVSQGGIESQARLAAIDPRSGVAFLKVGVSDNSTKPSAVLVAGSTSFLPPTSLTDSPLLTPVLAIGVPRGERPAVSLGMITGAQTHDGNRYFCVPQLLAGISLAEGEAGAPLLDLSGNLIGMVVSGGQGAGRILPSGAIEKLQRDFLRFGKFNPGWVGTVVETAAVPQGNTRTRVVSVEPGSPAESAGIQPGDMILSLAGKPIREPEEVLGASFYLSGGDPVRLVIIRGGERRAVDFRCGVLPDPLVADTPANNP